MTDQPTTLPGFDPDLGAALGFSSEDLAANAAGRLSEAQAGRLLAQARVDLRNRGLFAAFFVVIGVVFGFAIQDPLNIMLFAILIVSLGALTVRGWRDTQADLAAETVERAEGRIEQPNRRGLNSFFMMASEVVIGGRRAQLAVNTQRKLDLARTYRAYVAPHTGAVLALEPVSLPDEPVEPEAASWSEGVDQPEAD